MPGWRGIQHLSYIIHIHIIRTMLSIIIDGKESGKGYGGFERSDCSHNVLVLSSSPSWACIRLMKAIAVTERFCMFQLYPVFKVCVLEDSVS